MKARIIETGEEITIDGSVMSIFDIKGRCYYLSELTFIKDEIDWERRRYELAKDFMSDMIASPTYKYCKALEYDVNKPLQEHQDGLAKNAIIYTDRLIAELRKPNPDDEFSSIVEQAPNLYRALSEIETRVRVSTNVDWKVLSLKIRDIALSAIGRCK